MEILDMAILGTVNGDVKEYCHLKNFTQEEIYLASLEMPPLTLNIPSILNVLKKLRGGDVDNEIIQGWASFIKRGYISNQETYSLHPVIIEYDANHEDDIVEIISRLDEIGDKVDGLIGRQEINDMIKNLEAKI